MGVIRLVDLCTLVGSGPIRIAGHCTLVGSGPSRIAGHCTLVVGRLIVLQAKKKGGEKAMEVSAGQPLVYCGALRWLALRARGYGGLAAG
jgi:hypothetical protein